MVGQKTLPAGERLCQAGPAHLKATGVTSRVSSCPIPSHLQPDLLPDGLSRGHQGEWPPHSSFQSLSRLAAGQRSLARTAAHTSLLSSLLTRNLATHATRATCHSVTARLCALALASKQLPPWKRSSSPGMGTAPAWPKEGADRHKGTARGWHGSRWPWLALSDIGADPSKGHNQDCKTPGVTEGCLKAP